MNLCEVICDGTFSLIILWHPSLKNDQPSLMLLFDANRLMVELESSLQISSFLWVLALPHLKMGRLTCFSLVMVVLESI